MVVLVSQTRVFVTVDERVVGTGVVVGRLLLSERKAGPPPADGFEPWHSENNIIVSN